MEDARKRKKNLSVMWIDYKKAYDSVPHSWLIEVLKLYKINKHIANFIIRSMNEWKTKVYLPIKTAASNQNQLLFAKEYAKAIHYHHYSSVWR